MAIEWFSRFFSLGSPPVPPGNLLALEETGVAREDLHGGQHDLTDIIQTSTHLYYGPELIPTHPVSNDAKGKLASCWQTIPSYKAEKGGNGDGHMQTLCLPGQIQLDEVDIGGSRKVGEDQTITDIASLPISWSFGPSNMGNLGQAILKYLPSSDNDASQNTSDASSDLDELNSSGETVDPTKTLPTVRFALPEKTTMKSSSSVTQFDIPTGKAREEEKLNTVVLTIRPFNDAPGAGSEDTPSLSYHFSPSSLTRLDEAEYRMVQEEIIVVLQGQSHQLLPIYDADGESVTSGIDGSFRGKDGSEGETCVVCLASDRTITLLPCRHQCTCPECAISLARIDPATCPLCRREVSSWVRIHSEAVEEGDA
ncbi:hypothetical protein BJ684DRAFT_21067 [Piptocephalis cylindrospora]|uniref:RING-type domain-containing protein n=1 Tax=Piptocephalis cylindrospora TaxID=1907219 RepID=A0A4V1IXV6_9FUNG|nr:hypothetical protein BJ684DRAFT_21067 [Piptocephalis cylindrospora]|eukprot:RKP12389.1 hypothetical protein BJ684DRAFT_21067 [Piptocephalis cylindrospora]